MAKSSVNGHTTNGTSHKNPGNGTSAGNGTSNKAVRSVERGEILVVGTKVKDLIKSVGFMASSELLEALSVRVHDMLMDATLRAKENNRATVRPHDL